MMVLQRTFVTPEAFDRFVDLPENADKLFEYIAGEIVEVPSNPYASAIASNISFCIAEFIHGNRAGHITGEGAGYIVNGERYVPNVAYISRLRMPELPRAIGYVSAAPDLIVEVPSPADKSQHLQIKIANYLASGTLLWIVYPETKTVEIYAPGQLMRWVGIDDTIDGGDVLPGFTLAVRDIFPD
jgi:Uma2 family endonuclease